MGIFGKLFGKKKAPHVVGHAKCEFRPWGFPEPTSQVVLHSSIDSVMYTYDSTPLRDVHEGDEIIVEAYRGNARMTSLHTGYVWDTAEDGDCLVLYEGVPVGFVDIPKDEVYRAAKKGCALKLRARCCGWLAGYNGVKEMRAYVPSDGSIKAVVDAIK